MRILPMPLHAGLLLRTPSAAPKHSHNYQIFEGGKSQTSHMALEIVPLKFNVNLSGLKETVNSGSDADGCFVLAASTRDYTVAFGGAGYVRQELAVTVEAEVKKRVDGVMGKSV